MKTEIICGNIDGLAWSLQYRLGMVQNKIDGIYAALYLGNKISRITKYPVLPWNSGDANDFASSLERYSKVLEEDPVNTENFGVWDYFGLWEDNGELMSKTQLEERILAQIKNNM